jgi:hypothetical protein
MMARYQRETGNNTILPEHVDACLKLAAATCLDKLAAHYANDSQSTISSDSVEHGSKSDYYRRIANGYRAQYKEVVVSINKSTAHGKSILLPKRQRLR